MEGFHFVHPVEVRFSDLDVFGHVNNAVIFTYFEIARVHYMVTVGVRAANANLQSVAFIAAHLSCDYRKPIFYGQPVEVGARISELGRSSLRLEHRVEANGELAAEGSCILVHYDYMAGKSLPISDEIRAKVLAFEGVVVQLKNVNNVGDYLG